MSRLALALLNISRRRLVAKVVAVAPLIRDILISDSQYASVSMGMLIVYDFLLTLSDEVCKSYRLSDFQIS